MPLTWDLPAPRRRARRRIEDAGPTRIALEGGWCLHESSGKALGQVDARACSRAIRHAGGGRARPFAVRGEVPSEDERSACGCTSVVFGGVRMQMPEKTFGNNYWELRHDESGTVLCFDAIAALGRWAELSLALLDARRAGLPAWSGWTFDAAELKSAWARSGWSSTSTYRRREEWDWTFRSDFGGIALRGSGAAGACARRVEAMRSHRLIRTGAKSDAAATDAAELAWQPCDAAAAGAAWAAEEEPVSERHMKLYEDPLAELGVASLSLRLREFDGGWEVRVRWWCCLNPGCLPRRGVPQARLRDTTIRVPLESTGGCATVTTEERALTFTEAHTQPVYEPTTLCAIPAVPDRPFFLSILAASPSDYTPWPLTAMAVAMLTALSPRSPQGGVLAEGSASLDADEMRAAMPTIAPPQHAFLRLYDADDARTTPGPPGPPAPPAVPGPRMHTPSCPPLGRPLRPRSMGSRRSALMAARARAWCRPPTQPICSRWLRAAAAR